MLLVYEIREVDKVAPTYPSDNQVSWILLALQFQVEPSSSRMLKAVDPWVLVRLRAWLGALT